MAGMSSASAEFLSEIRVAAAQLGLAPTTLCQKAVRNHKLVGRLERGERVTVQTVEKFRTFVAAQATGRAASAAPQPGAAA